MQSDIKAPTSRPSIHPVKSSTETLELGAFRLFQWFPDDLCQAICGRQVRNYILWQLTCECLVCWCAGNGIMCRRRRKRSRKEKKWHRLCEVVTARTWLVDELILYSSLVRTFMWKRWLVFLHHRCSNSCSYVSNPHFVWFKFCLTNDATRVRLSRLPVELLRRCRKFIRPLDEVIKFFASLEKVIDCGMQNFLCTLQVVLDSQDLVEWSRVLACC